MDEPFLSEIRIFSMVFAPKGWALCNGQLLPINQNQALFSLLGTTYGGNGQTNFALPDLRGRVPIHEGSGHTLGEKAGSSAVTVTLQQLPQHVHLENAFVGPDANATQGEALNNFLSNSGKTAFSAPANLGSMAPTSISSVGGSQAHNNMMPYLVLSFCIALQGIFPSPN